MAKEKRILLVDDEKSFTNILKLNLEETGSYVVRVENWPEDAHQAAREFKPHIVFLDIIMPRLPGGNVAAQIDEDPDLKDTPIIFLTAAVRRDADQLGDALEVIDAVGPLDAAAHDRDLVDLLEHLRPNCWIGLEPPMATTGQQSISALARPVVRLMTPGPLAAMHTAGRCSSRL